MCPGSSWCAPGTSAARHWSRSCSVVSSPPRVSTAEVSSAGLAAPPGASPDRRLRRVAGDLGVDVDDHRSRLAAVSDLREAHLILTMTNEQTEQVLALDPSAAGRVVTLRAAAWRAGIVGGRPVPFDEWVSRLVGDVTDSRSGAARRGIRHPRPDRRSAARVPRHGGRGALARAGAGRTVEWAVRSRRTARLFGLDRPWPPVLRAVAGGAAGWAAIRWGVTEPLPAWARGGAAGVSAVGGLAAPAVARSAGATLVYGWASASAAGLYLGVPETDHVVGVAAVLAVLLLASLAAPMRATWVLVVGLDVVLAWAAVRGAPDGGPALVAGLAMPGLLVVAPVTSYLPGPRRAIVPSSMSLPRWSVCRPASPSPSPVRQRGPTRLRSPRPSLPSD